MWGTEGKVEVRLAGWGSRKGGRGDWEAEGRGGEGRGLGSSRTVSGSRRQIGEIGWMRGWRGQIGGEGYGRALPVSFRDGG